MNSKWIRMLEDAGMETVTYDERHIFACEEQYGIGSRSITIEVGEINHLGKCHYNVDVRATNQTVLNFENIVSGAVDMILKAFC